MRQVLPPLPTQFTYANNCPVSGYSSTAFLPTVASTSFVVVIASFSIAHDGRFVVHPVKCMTTGLIATAPFRATSFASVVAVMVLHVQVTPPEGLNM